MGDEMPRVTKSEICEAIAEALRDFGYPETTGLMIREIFNAFVAGKRGSDLPHGVIGRFAEGQLKELADAGADLASVDDGDDK
jgi:hypothetical protein